MKDQTSQGPRVFIRSKATCAAPLCEVLTPCRGLRPHHVQRDRTGTWEISCLAAVVACRVCTAVRIGKARSRIAGASAAEAVEGRGGAKGNTHEHNTYWTQSQARVTNALERIRPLSPSHTRGGSRMRESRTYGSVRGACDETHVPTATTPRVHHAAPGDNEQPLWHQS